MADAPDRRLPSSADVAAAQAKPLATLGSPIESAVQASAKPVVPVQATDKGEPAPDPSKAFVPPQPRVFPKDGPYAGSISGLPMVGAPSSTMPAPARSSATG